MLHRARGGTAGGKKDLLPSCVSAQGGEAMSAPDSGAAPERTCNHYWRVYHPGYHTNVDRCLFCGAIGDRRENEVFGYDVQTFENLKRDLAVPLASPQPHQVQSDFMTRTPDESPQYAKVASPGLTELEGSQENYVKVGESGRWFQVGFPDAVPPWNGKDRTVSFWDYRAAINHGKILWEEIQRIRSLIRFPILPAPAAPPSPSREEGEIERDIAMCSEPLELASDIILDDLDEVRFQDFKEAAGRLAAEVRRLRESHGMSWKSIINPPKLPRGHKDRDPGLEYLIWPVFENVGSTAFFGTRATNHPCFYKYGAEIHGITHWDYLPKGPRA